MSRRNEGLDELLSLLADVRQIRPNGWVALCPLHDDRMPSLQIDIVRRDGRPFPLVYCMSCGPVFAELLSALEMTGPALYRGLVVVDAPAGNPKTARSNAADPLPTARARLVREAHERLLGERQRMRWLRRERGLIRETVLRYRIGLDRGFVLPVYESGVLVNVRTYYPPGVTPYSGPKWSGVGGIPRMIYPDPRDMRSGSWILLVEGELDALIGRQYGLPAWTQTGGAAASLPVSWRRCFAGKNIAVCYDCDEPGRAGADRVAQQLATWGCRVRVVDLRLGRGEDLTDWFVSYDRTAKQLRHLIKTATDFRGVEQ